MYGMKWEQKKEKMLMCVSVCKCLVDWCCCGWLTVFRIKAKADSVDHQLWCDIPTNWFSLKSQHSFGAHVIELFVCVVLHNLKKAHESTGYFLHSNTWKSESKIARCNNDCYRHKRIDKDISTWICGTKGRQTGREWDKQTKRKNEEHE